MTTFAELFATISADCFRYNRQIGFIGFLRCGYENPGFKFTFWLRLCSFLFWRPTLKFPFYYLAKLILNHYKYKFGIDMPVGLDVGSGFYIGHFGGIVIGKNVVIGKNCNLSHGVTLGQVNRGENKGSPIIGNNVYVGVGAKVLGKIIVGDNAAIGANCVVIKNVPDNGVVVGVPGKLVSYNGSKDYVNNTDY